MIDGPVADQDRRRLPAGLDFDMDQLIDSVHREP
jgi:hypothetical protein